MLEYVVKAESVNAFKNRLDKEWSTISSLWTLRLLVYSYKKAVLSQRWPCDAPYIWMLWKFLRLLTMPMDTFPKLFRCTFVLIDS